MTGPDQQPPSGAVAGAPEGGPEVGDDPARAGALLAAGRLVAFGTETVYGLGASIDHPDAVARIFAVKGRPVDHPLIVHLADASDLDRVAVTSDAPRRLATAFWPGPLTLVLPRTPAVGDAVTGGRDTVAVRVPAPAPSRRMVAAAGAPVAAPSANRFGRVSPTSAAHVAADLGADVDYVLDTGPCAVGVESTIVDLCGPIPEVLRPGAIDAVQLAAVLGVETRHWVGDSPVRAPGMLEHHYAPRARVEVLGSGAAPRVQALCDEGRRVATVGLDPASVPTGVEVLAGPIDPVRFAHDLYALLREGDRRRVEVVVVVPPPPGGLGDAVRDRLARAAGRPPSVTSEG